MLKSIVVKILVIALMIVTPIVAGIAFYEYYKVSILNMKPAYPFGKYLNFVEINYAKQMLVIGSLSLAFAVLSYLTLLIKSLIKLLLIAVIVAVIYFLFQ